LERKGFVIVKPEKPIKYMAIAPNEVLDRVQRRLMERTEEKQQRLTGLKTSDILKELALLYKQGIEPMQPTDFSGALKGRHNLYDHLALLTKEAQSSITIATTEEGLIRKVRALKPILEKAKARGVKIRIAAPINEKTKEMVDKLDGIAEIKDLKGFSSRFCIVDSKQVLFMLMDDKDVHPTYDLGMWVSTPFFATALQEMFNNVWKAK
jgi:sugar-specific transcriptional regulator TrmB